MNEQSEKDAGSSQFEQRVRSLLIDSSDALDGRNGYVGWRVQQAAKRASENGRKTVRAHDFMIM